MAKTSNSEGLGFELSIQATPPLRLARAILLYTNSQRTFATVHECANVDGKPVILAGRTLTPGMSRTLAASVGKQAPVAQFLPTNVLMSTGDWLIWWEPPCVRHLGFKLSTQFPERSLGTRSGYVPTPGVVFVAGAQHWSVFAVQGRERPTPDTELYVAPFYNVDADGRICAGNVHVPRMALAERIATWNAAFFESLFPHPNYDGVVNYAGDATGLWRDLLDGQFGEHFPEEVMRPAKLSLGQLIQRIGAR
jgi:PRTRC genetic system protein B